MSWTRVQTYKDQTWYEVTVVSAGCFDLNKDIHGGFRARELEFPPSFARDLRFTAFSFHGALYISHEILASVLGGNAQWFDGRYLTYGRRKMWQVDEHMIEKMIKDNEYERRNSRELEVQERNWLLIEWLMEFV